MYIIQSKLVSLSHAKENWKTETLPLSRQETDKLLHKKMKHSKGKFIYRAIAA
jgi:hypothetical protein